MTYSTSLSTYLMRLAKHSMRSSDQFPEVGEAFDDVAEAFGEVGEAFHEVVDPFGEVDEAFDDVVGPIQ